MLIILKDFLDSVEEFLENVEVQSDLQNNHKKELADKIKRVRKLFNI